jgi:molybdopterin/thiamine biosynthesis adenylyltransferase
VSIVCACYIFCDTHLIVVDGDLVDRSDEQRLVFIGWEALACGTVARAVFGRPVSLA